jgi:amphi-Trp domain-containing protein
MTDRAKCVTTAHPARTDAVAAMTTNSMNIPTRAAPDFVLEERLSRHQAAERLVDIAYALTAGATLELRTQGEHVDVPVADEVVLKRTSTTDGRRVDVHIRLSWSGTRSPDDRRDGGH